MNRNLHHPRLRLKAANPAHTLEEPGAHVWGGGPVAGPDGRYYHLYARWAAEAGFHAWVTHSEIGWAVGDSPLGPWTVQGTLLGARRGWDQGLHKPDVHCFEGRYYLYYTGNHGDGDWWTHRPHQRVGVAVADHPAGPWERFEEPLVDVAPGTADHLITGHPCVARGPDGTYYLLYKGVSEGPRPFGGEVRWRIATASEPTGPFRKHPAPIFDRPGVKFPADDTYIWHEGDRFYAIVKDQGGHFADYGQGKALLLFESADGLHYEPAPDPLITRFELPWSNGHVDRGLTRLDEPQVLVEAGRVQAVYLSIRAHSDQEAPLERSYKVALEASSSPSD